MKLSLESLSCPEVRRLRSYGALQAMASGFGLKELAGVLKAGSFVDNGHATREQDYYASRRRAG